MGRRQRRQRLIRENEKVEKYMDQYDGMTLLLLYDSSHILRYLHQKIIFQLLVQKKQQYFASKKQFSTYGSGNREKSEFESNSLVLGTWGKSRFAPITATQ
jgi:hypothetical protein